MEQKVFFTSTAEHQRNMNSITSQLNRETAQLRSEIDTEIHLAQTLNHRLCVAVYTFTSLLVFTCMVLSHAPAPESLTITTTIQGFWVLAGPGIFLGFALLRIVKQNKFLNVMHLRYWYIVMHLCVIVLSMGMVVVTVFVWIFANRFPKIAYQSLYLCFESIPLIMLYVVMITAKADKQASNGTKSGFHFMRILRNEMHF